MYKLSQILTTESTHVCLELSENVATPQEMKRDNCNRGSNSYDS